MTYMTKNSNIKANIIKVILLEIGLPKFLYQIDTKYRYQILTQIDYVSEVLQKREIKLTESITIWKSSNKTIIEAIIDYLREKENPIKQL